MRLKGKTAIVTGAGGRIGGRIATYLAKEGANVVASDVKLDNVEKVVAEIRKSGAKAIAVKADVADATEVNAMVDAAIKEFGAVDILVNNAGGSAALLGKLSFFNESEEDVWDWVFRLNLKGVFVCIKAVINHMMERRCGRIVNIASIAGSVGIMQRVDYSAAKGGVIAMSKALAMEVGGYGVTVNCVSPGATGLEPVPSDMTYLNRTGGADEIASTVSFLASDEAAYITGQDYIVDGGRVLGPKTQCPQPAPEKE